MVKNLPVSAEDMGSIPGLRRSPEEVMEIHSSILVWRILWTEEPGRLPSKGSQRVRCNLVTKTTTIAITCDRWECWGMLLGGRVCFHVEGGPQANTCRFSPPLTCLTGMKN